MIKNMNEILLAASKASKEQLHGYVHQQKEVELIGEENLLAEEVDWSKKNTGSYSNKKIPDWNTRDFLAYCYSKYRSITGQNWPISYRGAQEGLKLMQEQLKSAFGEWPSSRLTKLYIDWFFAEQAESLIASYSMLSFKMLRNEYRVTEFFEFCKEQRIEIKTQVRPVKETATESCSNEKALSTAAAQSVDSVLASHGVLACYQWLRKQGENDAQTSIKKICSAVKENMNPEQMDKLFMVTEKFGPYPSNMKKEFSELLKALAKATSEPFTLISVEYIDEPK